MNVAIKKLSTIVLLCLFQGAFASLLSAAEYSLQTGLTVKSKYDNNINLEVDNPDSIYGEIINPTAKIKMRTETWRSDLKADLRFSNFNRPGFDSDDQVITASTEKFTEKTLFTVSGRATHDTTRTSEELDSGRRSNDRRKLYSLTPLLRHTLADRQSLTLSANLSTSEYDDENYTGYDYIDTYAEWSYVYSEKLSYFIRANGSRYESDGRTQDFLFARFGSAPITQEQTYVVETDSVGFQLGANYRLTEKLMLEGLFGNSATDTAYTVFDDINACDAIADDPTWQLRGACSFEDQDSTTDLVNTSISWEEERQNLSLAYSLQTQPSSDGYLLEYERVNLDWQYDLSELSQLTVRALWSENQALDDPDEQAGVNRSNRLYQSLSFDLRYRLTQTIYLSTSLRYRFQDREFQEGEAESVDGQLSITYRPQIKVWSR